jgi:hypothetical protein
MAEWCVGKLLRSVAISRKSVIVCSFLTQKLLSALRVSVFRKASKRRGKGVKSVDFQAAQSTVKREARALDLSIQAGDQRVR